MSNEISGNRYNLTDAIIRQSERINSTNGNSSTGTAAQVNNGRSFQEILNEQLNQRITFSKHTDQIS